MGYIDTVYYCPQCEYKVVLDRSTFKCWNQNCPGCGEVKLNNYVPQYVHYESIYEFVKQQKVEEAKTELAIMKKLGIA